MYVITKETLVYRGGVSLNDELFVDTVTFEKDKAYSVIHVLYLRGVVIYYVYCQGKLVQLSSNGRAKNFKIIETPKVWCQVKRLLDWRKLHVI